MEITFIQITKEELFDIINEAVKAAMPTFINTNPNKPFIKGIHELAEFLGVSAPRAQKLKNAGISPYFQDGRTVLFDPIKVKIAMEQYQQNRKKLKGRKK
jgi:hypothetical protein